MPKGPMMNWAEIIPPPPEQPPSDVGSAPNTPASHRGVSPHSRQLKQKPLSGCSQASLISSRVMQGAPRFMGPSPRASLNKSSNSIGACYADPSTGPHFATRDLRPVLRPALQSQPQTQPSPFCQTLMDRGVQSSLPSLVSESHSLPPALEVSGPHSAALQGHVYHPMDGESDAEDITRPQSLESSVAGDTDYAPSHAPSWASMTEQSNSSCTSGRSSGASSYDDSVYNEVDFANAVALAAQNAGLQANGSIISTARLINSYGIKNTYENLTKARLKQQRDPR